MTQRLTAIIQREGDEFVAHCPELDIASQGDTVEATRDNLRKALELFFECASPAEIQQRFKGEVFVTQWELHNAAMSTTPSGPVIDEVHEVRRRISERFGHDPSRIVAHYTELQKGHGGKLLGPIESLKHAGEERPGGTGNTSIGIPEGEI